MKLERLLFLLFFFPLLAGAQDGITLSGQVKEEKTADALSYVSVVLKKSGDSSFVTGTITNQQGFFTLTNLVSGNYVLDITLSGYKRVLQPLRVGKLSAFLDAGTIQLEPDVQVMNEVRISAAQGSTVSDRMDKKTFSLANNISQGGGSVLQAISNLPGITVTEGKVQLRGSDKVMVLVDGRQTALTGFGNQAALDNIPASAIERIEIINNPSARFDAAGKAGIINIIYKKRAQQGFGGKIGFTTGLGALWEKRENFPTIRPQYSRTPKFNPSLSLNYRKNKVNAFLQADYLYNKTLNKNDFTDRFFSNGDTIRNQVKRNRITTVGTGKAGMDWQLSQRSSITVSGLFSSEYVRDNGDIPYFNSKLTERFRLWQFYEDEVNSAATASATFQHRFPQAGHQLNVNFNYTFHREDEKYFLTNRLPTYTGRDTFMLIADEHVTDVSLDYVRPLKQGRLESGFKFRNRTIPTNMQFFPGLNSPLDVGAAGRARYKEVIPAVYSNYVYESKHVELEAGMRVEYVNLQYDVDPNHNTYKSDGYSYTQPFPNIRLAYKLNESNKLSLFYNRRVDRPDEGDIRIFPKYDDPEILKVGNPTLQPQFTNTVELGYRKGIKSGFFYAALYHKTTDGTITRIGTTVPGRTIIYSIFQNAGKSYNSGTEMLLQQNIGKVFSFNTALNIYRNRIEAFSVTNKYPVPTVFTAQAVNATSGNVKLNSFFRFANALDLQVTAVYLAPDIIPQGKIRERFSVDAGLKKQVQKGKGELFANASDIFNTLRIQKRIEGTGFTFLSTDYYETQVFRLGYSYKF